MIVKSFKTTSILDKIEVEMFYKEINCGNGNDDCNASSSNAMRTAI